MKYFALSLALFSLCITGTGQESKLKGGQKAPNFTLEDVNGNSVELKSLLPTGPVVLNFWATWCKPCLEELAEMQKIAPAYQSRGVTMLAISLDSEKSIAKVKPLVKGKGYPFTILLDTNSDVARIYYVQVPPHTFVINKTGNIVYSHTGYRRGDEKEVGRILDELLAQ